MEFEKYQHVCRLGNLTEGILNGQVYIESKIDGCNASIWLGDDGEVHCGSRKREVTVDDDNQGFAKYISENSKFKKYLLKHKDYRVYGEWLVPHTIRTYDRDSWRKFYVFDIVDTKNNRYIKPDEYDSDLSKYNIEYIPYIIMDNPTEERLIELMNENHYRMQEGEVGEGIVLKNYGNTDDYKSYVWAKLVHSEFQERKNNNHKRKREEVNGNVEKAIVDKYLTMAVVMKEYSKVTVDMGLTERGKIIPTLINKLYDVILEEEMKNVIKDFNKPTINFKLLFNECRNKLIEVYPELFA